MAKVGEKLGEWGGLETEDKEVTQAWRTDALLSDVIIRPCAPCR